ncbi:hypothetical protein COW20_16780 [bacterium (Candidatus Blackallbacteria) CG13_big_fil_rev_8_21_14_2_50_49_14]|nr:MAG: hypothetical protein COW20_16780 [bacterium (Candidatus Blackallbacteria) CG13_big_fil_rev_8_21_14_2_50_49_14]
MGMVTGSIIKFLFQSPKWLRAFLVIHWVALIALAIFVTAFCVNAAFLPLERQWPLSLWDLVLAVAGLKLFSVFLSSLHELRMRQLAGGLPGLALTHLQWALRFTPGNPELYYAWGHLLYLQGDLSGAREKYKQVTQIFPLDSAAEVYLGRLELSVGHWQEAHGHFARAYRLARGIAWNDLREWMPEAVNEAVPHRFRTSWSKLNFDQEQLDFLIQGHYLSGHFKLILQNYQDLLRDLASQNKTAYPIVLSAEQHAKVLPVLGRNIHISPVPEFPSELVRIEDTERLEASFQKDGILVLDSLLAPDACEALLHFCQKSTIWHDDHKSGGYLGSYMDDGFNCPLLYQVARELKEKLPGILGAWSLLQMWGYNHDSQCEGIGLHADAAHVNINLWLTPESANQDPEHGGLLVFPLEAPQDWSFQTLNTETERMQALIQAEQISPVKIAYRQNRAVIFRSRFFHATDQVNFKPGYLNRRINITFLYGRYQPDLKP